MRDVVDLDGLYDEHAEALFRLLLSLTRDEADTRDVLQGVFVKIARQPELLEGVRDLRGFLIRMAHNAAVDLIRRRDARQRAGDALTAEVTGVFAPSDDPDEQAFRVALTGAMEELPPDQRAVIHLKLWEGLTFDAIAQALDLPLNTAASRYRYGIDKLRARLRPLYDEIR